MTRYSTPQLSNCYTPLPLPPTDILSAASESDKSINVGRKKRDGNRESHQLRQLYLERSVISSATGSCLLEIGHTKVLCEIIGPTTNTPASIPISLDEGTLHCDVKYAPNFGFPIQSLVASSVSQLDPNNAASGNSNSNQQQQQSLSVGKISSMIRETERDLSTRLLSSLLSAVPLQDFPKNAIIVKITILQDDGCVLSACVTAASMALVDAGIEVKDLVTSSTVAVLSDDNSNNENQKLRLYADPTQKEITQAQAVIILSMLPNYKQVTLWDQSGKLTSDMANQAIELCRDGCRTMHKFMRQNFIQQYQ